MVNNFPGKFPPVNPTPTVDDCLRSTRVSDVLQLGGFTVASWGYGFMVGRPARFGLAGLMAGIGFTFGSMVLLQNTRGRLMGFRENEREHKLFDKKFAEQQAQEEPKMDFRKFN